MDKRRRDVFGSIVRGRQSLMEPEEVRAYIDSLKRQRSRYESAGARVYIDAEIRRQERRLAQMDVRPGNNKLMVKRVSVAAIVAVGILILLWALTSGPHDEYKEQLRDETSNPFE